MTKVYNVEIRCEGRGVVEVEASSKEEALLIATDRGLELSEVSELTEFVARSAEEV